VVVGKFFFCKISTAVVMMKRYLK